MKQLHICFVSRTFPLTTRVSNTTSLWPIAERFAEMGHKVSIVTYKSPDSSNHMKKGEISIHFVSSQNEFVSVQDFSDQAAQKISQIHSNQVIDHVHSIDTAFKKFKRHFLKSRPSLSYGSQASNMEQMFSLFNLANDSSLDLIKTNFLYPLYFLKKLFLSADYKALREAGGIFVSSPKQALALERYYLYPPNWVFQVPLDSYISDLSLKQKSTELLEKYSLPKNSPVVATASKMTKPNELIFLLDVFEKVVLSHPDARFLIAGSGPCFKEVERAVLLKALDSKVIFTKQIPHHQISECISLSDVYINISSQTSGFGQSLIEAMAQKKVIIGSEFSPISHIIESGKNGYLIRPGEITKCANFIDSIFAGNLDKEGLGQQAREDILKALDQDLLIERTLNAFKKINSRKTRLFSF